MAPSEYFLRLQEGITGGFAPPNPNAIHQIARSSENPSVLAIQSLKRPSGTPDLAPLAPKQSPHADHEKDVDELVAILKTLPVESPPGSEDIYGLDTSIAFGSSDLEWANGGPSGCGTGNSQTQATPEQKEKFKRAVALVKRITGE